MEKYQENEGAYRLIANRGQGKMQKKYVRIANAILDLEPRDIDAGSLTSDKNDNTAKSDRSGPIAVADPEVISVLKDRLDGGLLSNSYDPEAVDLRAEISRYTGILPEFIGCFAGEEDALGYISRTFLEPGTEMVVSGPVRAERLITARSTGAAIKAVQYDDPLSPGIEPLIDTIGNRTRIIYIGNPSDTIGSFFTEAELVFLLAYAEQAMLVLDESCFELSGFSAAEFVKKFPNLTVIRSLARPFGLAGMRASYVISDPENIGYFDRLRSDAGIDGVTQAAAFLALERRLYKNDYFQELKTARRNLSSMLPELGYDFFIAPADFFILRVSDPEGSCRHLEKDGVSAIHLKDIRHMEGHIRVAIGNPWRVEELLLILSRMAEKYATGFNRNRVVRTLKAAGQKTAGTAT